MITLTSKAITELQSLNTDNLPLRVQVIGGGCSGLSYKLEFDDATHPTDKLFSQDGINIVVDPRSLLYLQGLELDFTDGLNGKGFIFNNPNAKRTCGCGESFST